MYNLSIFLSFKSTKLINLALGSHHHNHIVDNTWDKVDQNYDQLTCIPPH